MADIKVQNLFKNFGSTEVLRGINLEIASQSQQVLIGASGSGKSTLLHLIGGLERYENGEILFSNKDLKSLNDAELAFYRNRKVGFVFQFHFLLSSMNSLDNILLPARIGGLLNPVLKSEVLELSSLLGVDHCLKKYPFELSGGEQQRINIIRSLSMKPEILLCDEPTGNLDTKNSQKVIDLLRELSLQRKNTLLIVTHDSKIANQFDRKITIEDGRIIG